jgi:hypothetical protein
MSRPIFSAVAAVTVDQVIAPPQQSQQPARCELEPGLRMIEGRVFYSAAWLDQVANSLRTPEPEARSAGRPKAVLGG